MNKFPYPLEVTGGLTEAEFKAMLIEYAFPYPPEVNGGAYPSGTMSVIHTKWLFPYPLEVTGVSYVKNGYVEQDAAKFPSPREVTGGSYRKYPSTIDKFYLFPSPLEVTGVSYEIKRLFYLAMTSSFRPLSR